MDDKTLEMLKKTQLEIANEFKRICELSHLRYSLDSGSLLGAVRHKGFIPWDDDMDFGMPYEDYEHFLKIAGQRLDKKYLILTWDDSSYPYPFAKIVKKGTLYVEDVFVGANKHNEIFIDVFPYYKMPTSKSKIRQMKKIDFYRTLLFIKSGMKPWKSKQRKFIFRLLSFIKYLPYIMISPFAKRIQLINNYKKRLEMGKNDKNFYRFPAGVSKFGKWLIPEECFLCNQELSFEGLSFKAYYNYSNYLSAAYGDYMVLPPISERKNKHNPIKISF